MPAPAGGVTLGTTALDGTGFLPLEGDQPLVPGAQGGFHIWLKYRVMGMPVGKVKVHREARRVSDNHLLLTTDGVQEIGEPGPDGTWELPEPIPSFMCPSPIGVQVQDQPARFELRLESEDGMPLGEGSAIATPRCPDTAQKQFCEKICAG